MRKVYTPHHFISAKKEFTGQHFEIGMTFLKKTFRRCRCGFRLSSNKYLHPVHQGQIRDILKGYYINCYRNAELTESLNKTCHHSQSLLNCTTTYSWLN